MIKIRAFKVIRFNVEGNVKDVGENIYEIWVWINGLIPVNAREYKHIFNLWLYPYNLWGLLIIISKHVYNEHVLFRYDYFY